MLDKKGFISVETVLASVFLIMLLLTFISFFNYFSLKKVIQNEVHVLTQKAKIQGGLTDMTSEGANSDIEIFKDFMSRMGFSESEVKITAITHPSGQNAIGVTPLNKEGSNYVKRGSKEIIVVRVEVPVKNFISAPLSYMLRDGGQLSKMTFEEGTLSERW